MRKQIKFIALTALLSLPVTLMAADNSWYNPKNWFNKNNKTTSTTVTGNVESNKGQVVFKTVDGQTLVLLGKKASDVGDCGTEAKIRVFGNVYQPSEKYPAGALQVRNFRVIEGNTKTGVENTPVSDVITAEPEPYEEPVLETTTEVIPEVPVEQQVEKYEDEDDDVVVEVVDEATASKAGKSDKAAKTGKTYVVQSGDTLGKISSKVLGTTTKWKKIAEANGITNPRHLKVGMTLVIPE